MPFWTTATAKRQLRLLAAKKEAAQAGIDDRSVERAVQRQGKAYGRVIVKLLPVSLTPWRSHSRVIASTEEILHRHPREALGSALAGEAQAKLLDDEMIRLVDIAPGERFAGRGDAGVGRRAGGSLVGKSSIVRRSVERRGRGFYSIIPHRVVTPCDSQFTMQPVNTLSLWRSSLLAGWMVGCLAG